MSDPVDLLLEWLGHCVGDDLRARARIEAADDDLGLIDPASIMMTAMADAKIGRWIKNPTMLRRPTTLEARPPGGCGLDRGIGAPSRNIAQEVLKLPWIDAIRPHDRARQGIAQ